MCQYGVFRRNLTNICIYKEKQRREMVLLGDLYCVRKNANEVHDSEKRRRPQNNTPQTHEVCRGSRKCERSAGLL